MKALNIFLLLAFSSCSFGQNGNKESQEPVARSMEVDDFKALLEKKGSVHLLDVRTPGEFESGHIKDAQNIDWNGSGFDEKVAKLSKDTPVFVYCHSGGRSKAAMRRLKKLGFMEIYELNGGITAWKAKKRPIIY